MARLELSGNVPPCMILDDDELNRQRGFRLWREEKQEIAAARIFGGARTEVSGPKPFPSAFQSYKADKQGGKSFPFMKLKQNTQVPVSSVGRPRAELQTTQEKGHLIASVKAMFEEEDLLQKARDIAEFGIKLEPIDTDSVKNAGLIDEEGDYMYAACTPPPEGNGDTQ